MPGAAPDRIVAPVTSFVPVISRVSPEVVPCDLWPVAAIEDTAWVRLNASNGIKGG